MRVWGTCCLGVLGVLCVGVGVGVWVDGCCVVADATPINRTRSYKHIIHTYIHIHTLLGGGGGINSYLLFSDVKNDKIMKYSDTEGVTVWKEVRYAMLCLFYRTRDVTLPLTLSIPPQHHPQTRNPQPSQQHTPTHAEHRLLHRHRRPLCFRQGNFSPYIRIAFNECMGAYIYL